MTRFGIALCVSTAIFAGLPAWQVRAARADGISVSASPAAPTHQNASESEARSKIRMMMMGKVGDMNAKQTGIFHEDVTAAVARFFPPGQMLRDTEAILKEQDLGTLKKFMGMQDPAKGTMYVATFMLMNGMASNIRVVLDFDFDGPTYETMTMRSMKAFISASSM